MARRRRPMDVADAKGDMTPMIDCVFLLLIFFILMPFKSIEAKIESHLPKDSGQGKGNPSPDVEKVDVKIKRIAGMTPNPGDLSGIDVIVGSKRLPNFQSLRIRLQEIRGSLKSVALEKVPVELNADEDVPFYFVLKALDYSKLNGFVNIKFPAPPELEFGKKPVKK